MFEKLRVAYLVYCKVFIGHLDAHGMNMFDTLFIVGGARSPRGHEAGWLFACAGSAESHEIPVGRGLEEFETLQEAHWVFHDESTFVRELEVIV